MTPLCRLLALQLAFGVAMAVAVYWALADTNARPSRRPPGSMLALEPIDLSDIIAGVNLDIDEETIVAALGLSDETITLKGHFGEPPAHPVPGYLEN